MPLELAQQSFGRAVDTCSVNLVVTVLLEGIDDGCDVFNGVDAGSFGAWFCLVGQVVVCSRRKANTFFTQSHCAKDKFEVSLCLRLTEIIAHGDGDKGLGDGLGLCGGHLDYCVDSWCSCGNFLRDGRKDRRM